MFQKYFDGQDNYFRGHFKDCILQMDLQKKWIRIINSEGKSEVGEIDEDCQIFPCDGEFITEDWTLEEWLQLSSAVKLVDKK